MVSTRHQVHLKGNDDELLAGLDSKGHAVKLEEAKVEKKVVSHTQHKAKVDKGKQKNVSKTQQSKVEAHDSDTDEDDDIEALLYKAEEALRNQEQSENAERLPKLDSGLSVKDQLYIVSENDRAKMTQELAVLDDDSAGSSKSKAFSVLTPSKTDAPNKSRTEKQKERETTAGKGWFDMPKTEITPEIKRDLQVIRLRNVLDRKRHYKKGDQKDPTYFQMGTIIEGPTEFFSSRMTKRERKQTIVDELLADEEARGYYKRRFMEVQERTQSGGKKHFKKLKAKRAKKW
ncbi:hypothetical protein INT43_008191 [Umbelopsis isabellina]|uniref:Fcf2 pre-rRNA processing C-terminal domain-containing protein n=1 Tax=Mortierella isabellina TaxID=91625 RepID=A0A8H7PEE1_MORIS|nr:hypothetical protein INT43_008191 [Umbelopsis isabellina]